jgi:uncharacterized protein
MSERDGYQAGVPCWIDTWQPDAAAAAGFYTQLFGWTAEDIMPADSPARYFMCKLRGRDVAAVGGPSPEPSPGPSPGPSPEDALPVPAWCTYIWVDSADASAARVTDAGGSVVMEPFDSLSGGRIAVVVDPAGALFGLWQPGAHKGAQLVNEPGAWAMSQLNTRDTAGAKAFYGAVLGWETDTFDMGEGEITLWRVPGYVGGEPEQPVSREVVGVMAPMSGERFPADATPHWSVNFWVDDTDAIADRAVQLGGEAVVPPYDAPGFREAVLADPQGAAFSVSKLTAGA